MEMKLSATRIETFLECKYKYYCNYMEHMPKVPSPAFRLGIAVHESLELAGRIWMKKGALSGPDMKKVLSKYTEIAIREGIKDMNIYKGGITLVDDRIKDFELGKKILGLEIKFGFEGTEDVTTKDGVPLMGSIDKAIEYDEDTLLIVDYKTSKTAPTTDQLKENLQLSIYDLTASKKWPNYQRVILSLDMLKFGILFTYRTLQERSDFEAYLKNVYDSMSAFTKKEAKPQLNIFCPWCDYREYCAEYQKACKRSDYKFLSAMALSDADLIREWNEVKSIKKILDERERELGMIIVEKIKKFDVNPQMGRKEIYIRQNARTLYDKDKVKQFLTYDEFVSAASGIDKKALESFIQKNPSIKPLLERDAAITTSYTSPFLAMRTLKNGEGEPDDVEEDATATEQP